MTQWHPITEGMLINAFEFYNKDSGAAIEVSEEVGNKKGASIDPPTLRGGKGISNG